MNVWPVIITFLTLATAVLAGVSPLISPYLGKGRKLFVWRVISDNPAVSAHHDIESRVQILLDGRQETELNLLVLHIESAGTLPILGNAIVRKNPLEDPVIINDYNPHLRFLFEDREVLELTDIKTEPDRGIVGPTEVELPPQGTRPGYITLPTTVTLNPKQTIRLSILLKGAKKGVQIVGGLKNGEVRTHKEHTKRLRTRNRIAWGVGSVAVMLFLGTVFFSHPIPMPNSNPLPPFCASGKITIGGSTAIEAFVTEAKKQYESNCPEASITINQGVTSSKDGLSAVEAGQIIYRRIVTNSGL